MTPREFLAVAVLVSTNYDEMIAERSRAKMESARTGGFREFWRAYHEEDLQRIGAKRALWLDVHG